MKTDRENQKITNIPDDVWQLVKFRIMQSMPATAKLAIGGVGTFSKEDVLEHLTEKDETGELIVRMQLSMLKYIAKTQND